MLYDSKSHPLSEQFLDSEEQIAIGSALPTICENLFIPKHLRERKTIHIKKLFLPEFDFHAFINDLCKCISGVFEIRISLSFLAHKFTDKTDKIMYFFAIPARMINIDHNLIKTKSDINDLSNFLAQFSKPDLLNHVFARNNAENPFERSGFSPRKLVLCTCWITK